MRVSLPAFLAFLLTAPASAPAAAPATAAPGARTIQVSAMAEIKVVPDEVVLRVTVMTRDDKSLAAAKEENDRKTRNVLALARKFKVPEERVQIDSVSMGPVYDRHSDEVEVLYYRVSREIEFVIRDFETLEPLISEALFFGATNVGDILYRTTKHREQQFETRRLAVTYAREKASHLTELNGLKLGKAVDIQESVEGDEHTIGMGMGGMGGMMGPTTATEPNREAKIRFAAEEKKPDVARSPIAPGQITIRSTVTITFEMLE